MTNNSYNQRASIHQGWGYALPHLTQLPHPPEDLVRLARAFTSWRDDDWSDDGSDAFVGILGRMQRARGIHRDGKLGPATWGTLAREVRTSAGVSKGQHLFVAGVPVPFDDGGVLNVTQDWRGAFGERPIDRRRKQKVVIHWGGFSAEQCKQVLQSRGLSSHLLAEPFMGDDGRLQVHQCVDLAALGAHARGFNLGSIGIDICRTPRVDLKRHMPQDVPVLPNHTGRAWTDGNKYLDLGDAEGAAIWQLATAVSDTMGIDFSPVYPGHNVVHKPGEGIFGHHHLTYKKADVAVWASRIWPRMTRLDN